MKKFKNYLKKIDWLSLLFNMAIVFVTVLYVRNETRKHYELGLDRGIKGAFDTIQSILNVANTGALPVSLKIDSSKTYILRRKDLIEKLKKQKK